MEFKTELHCHSRDASGCSSESAEGIVRKYTEAGYTTLCLTNHFCPEAHDDDDAAWKAKVDKLYRAYDILTEAAGDRLTILMGMELRFRQNSNDYLVFGFDRDYLMTHRDIMNMGIGNYIRMAREDGLLTIQAHPFRTGMTVTDPRRVDGIEIFNGHPGHNSHNDIAELWAKQAGVIMTSGTDHHNPDHLPDGGIVTSEPITSVEQLIAVLKSGEYTLIRG